MPFNPTQIIGKSITDVVCNILPSIFDTPPENEIIEDRIYSTFKQEGFGMVADLNEKIVSIHLHSDGFDDLVGYCKFIPGGVLFTDDHQTVRIKLGVPLQSASSGKDLVSWDRFQWDGVTVHVQYGQGGNVVELVTIS